MLELGMSAHHQKLAPGTAALRPLGWMTGFAIAYHPLVQVENLANRSDISDEEKQRRRKKLEEEVAAGVVGGGILGYAGYHHHEKKEEKESGEGGEKHHHHLHL